MLEFNISPALIGMFWERVIKGGEEKCWIWLGTINKKDGYGRLDSILAHRVSYYIHFGSFDAKLKILHRCDVKHCVNPHHLFLGTQAENMLDMAQKDRSTYGSLNSQAKLNEEQVIWVKWQLAMGVDFKSIAAVVKVAESTIENIARGRNWRRVI